MLVSELTDVLVFQLMVETAYLPLMLNRSAPYKSMLKLLEYAFVYAVALKAR